MSRHPLLALLAAALLAACGSDSEAPADHTDSKEGTMHKPGSGQPFTNCSGCHGASLQGGDEAPSCTRCHGVKW